MFSVGEVGQTFEISTVIPNNVIVCGDLTLQSVGLDKPSTLAVVYNEEGDLLEQLEHSSLTSTREKVCK